MSIYKERPTGTFQTYIATDPDGKQYVGYCNGPYKKRSRNGRGYGNNPHLQAAIKKYGVENIKMQFPNKDLPVEFAADIFEPWWVAHLDCMLPNGYNMTSGGRRGYTRCQETRDKIAAARRGKPSKGTPIDQIDPETGVILYSWPSLAEASRATGISVSAIWRATHGQPNKAAVYDWKLVE